jgi:hypothetical protein
MTELMTLALALTLTLTPAGALAVDRSIPDPTLTPGVTRPLTTKVVCATKWGLDRRHVTTAMRKQVFSEYGIPWSQHAQFEVDHLDSRELAGADKVENLWPQPWKGEWNAHMKDQLENRLHKLVCNRTLTLRQAQEEIRTDWRRAYQKYVSVEPAKPSTPAK